MFGTNKIFVAFAVRSRGRARGCATPSMLVQRASSVLRPATLAARRLAAASWLGGSSCARVRSPFLSPQSSLLCTAVPSPSSPAAVESEATDASLPEVIWKLRRIAHDMPPAMLQAFGRDNMCALAPPPHRSHARTLHVAASALSQAHGRAWFRRADSQVARGAEPAGGAGCNCAMAADGTRHRLRRGAGRRLHPTHQAAVRASRASSKGFPHEAAADDPRVAAPAYAPVHAAQAARPLPRRHRWPRDSSHQAV